MGVEEQLRSVATAPSSADGEADGGHNGVEGGGGGGGGDDGGMRAPRLPRWTRQEILVLIQGKRVAENRVRRGRTAGLAFGGQTVEPKWASVSSYCKRHGVNRGPVQCRKRWSNLAGDYKKIKEWETIRQEATTESFWVMRNDLRREKKLPGFFDREVYDILDGGAGAGAGAGTGTGGSTSSSSTPRNPLALALGPSSSSMAEAEAEEVKEEEPEAVFDSGRSAAADDGLFSDFEQQHSGGGGGGGGGQDDDDDDDDDDEDVDAVVVGGVGATPTLPHKFKKEHIPIITITNTNTSTSLLQPLPAPIPIPPFSGKENHPFTQGVGVSPGHEERHTSNPDTETAREGRKRKRVPTDGDEVEANMQHKLIQALENNGRLLSSHLEAQNTNFQLDREQRKDHINSLVQVLNKLADAFGKIADKL